MKRQGSTKGREASSRSTRPLIHLSFSYSIARWARPAAAPPRLTTDMMQTTPSRSTRGATGLLQRRGEVRAIVEEADARLFFFSFFLSCRTSTYLPFRRALLPHLSLGWLHSWTWNLGSLSRHRSRSEKAKQTKRESSGKEIRKRGGGAHCINQKTLPRRPFFFFLLTHPTLGLVSPPTEPLLPPPSPAKQQAPAPGTRQRRP